jgi:hypothetical protein
MKSRSMACPMCGSRLITTDMIEGMVELHIIRCLKESCRYTLTTYGTPATMRRLLGLHSPTMRLRAMGAETTTLAEVGRVVREMKYAQERLLSTVEKVRTMKGTARNSLGTRQFSKRRNATRSIA